MADVSKIKLPDGTTYNIKDTTSGYTTPSDIANKTDKLIVNLGDQISGDYYQIDKTYSEIGWAVLNGDHLLFSDGKVVYPYLGVGNIDGTVLIGFGFSATYNGTAMLQGYAVLQNDTAMKLHSFTDIPTSVSQLTNDSGFITNETESDPVFSASAASGITASDITNWNSKSTATNWVNGSQTGSVRTANSAAEDSSYTMGLQAVAEGGGTKASGDFSHAEGGGTVASGNTSHAEGGGTTASGIGSHAEGGSTQANGQNSHAEGYSTTAGGEYSHAEGGSTTASSQSSHAEGGNTTASGEYSHAEGGGTVASGYISHAEGGGTTASGSQSHAEGSGSQATGDFSHASGTYTIAQRKSQTTIGEYNYADTTGTTTTRGSYVFIIGNGTGSSARSNALTVDWSGNEWLAGKLTLGTTGTNSMDVATVGQLPTKVSDLTNDSGFITGYTETDPTVPSWAKASTKPTYTASEVGALASNTTYVSKITTTAGAHTAISNKSGAVSFNVPTKTSHLTNDSGYLTNSTLYEGHLNWGNINLTGNVTPIGMSLSAEHSANRIAYLNPAAVQIEYTTNGGSSWVDSGYTNDEKTWLCTGNATIAVGQSKSGYSQSTALTTNHWTRITLTGQNGTTQYVYTSPRKLLVNVSTRVGLNCLVEYKTGVSGASWQTFGTYAVSGWSGWNDIPLILSTFGGGSTQTSNYWYLRFTFKVTSTRTDSYKGYAQVLGLRLFGATDWGSASSNNSKGPFSSTGHLYSYDIGANATFPAKVTASGGFSGNLTGNVTGNVSGSAGSVAWSGVSSKPTTISGYGITDAKISNGTITLGSDTITPLTSSSTLNAAKLSGTIPTSCYTNSNTTYTLTNALSSHKFTWTFTAGGSGSGSTTTMAELVAGSNITLTDDTTNKKITIAATNTDHRKSFYGTCSTAAGTAAKVISLSTTTGWELVAGTTITVKFSATNTAQNPTFNVNSSGAKSVWYNTAVITTGSLNRAGYATRPQMYVYDGSHWVWMGMSAEDNTTYSVMSASELSTGTATTARTMSAANTKAGLLDLFYPVGSYYETSDTDFDPNTKWGGTWVLEVAGQVHVSAGTGYTVSGALNNTSDGGSKDAIIPYHNHSVAAVTNGITGGGHTHEPSTASQSFLTLGSSLTNGIIRTNAGSGSGVKSVLTSPDGTVSRIANTNSTTHSHDLPAHSTNYAGTSGNATNANMQPYVVVNRWHRTA